MRDSSEANLPPKIVFLHTQKTAGTSITHWLQKHYAHAQVLHEATVWPELLRLSPALLAGKRLVRGHFGTRILAEFGPAQGFQPITLIRDPVKRVLSHFWHIKRAPDADKDLDFCRDPSFTLTDFLEHPQTRIYASNYQTSCCAFGQDSESVSFYSLNEYVTPDLESAKRFLDQCVVVGLSEDLPAFLTALADRFGFSQDQWLPAERSYTEGSAEVPDALLERIRALNALDLALYEHARRCAPAAAPPGPSRVARNPNVLGADGIMIWSAGQPYFGHGWTDVQSATERPHLWSTMPRSVMQVQTGAAHVALAVTVVARRFVTAGQATHFSLVVNGAPVPLLRVQSEGLDLLIFVGCIPPSEQTTLTLEFCIDRLVSFRALNPKDLSDEPRGIALASVALRASG